MVRVRIAPSPTGNCHVGTARTALFNLLFARRHQGTMILRIDDTDQQRSTKESEEGVLAGLRWLGLVWDEGPDSGGPHGPYRQSERREIYHRYAQELVASGHAYLCYCTPAELESERAAQENAKLAPRYAGRCARLTESERTARAAANALPAVRLRVPAGDLTFDDVILGPVTAASGVVGDFIIMKSDGLPTYNFATVIDDHLMRITHVLRGQEHVSNTFPQLAIYQALGWQPPHFGHFNLMLNPDKTKISKRRGAVYIGEFRAMGYLPETMLNFLALQGWNPGDTREVFTLDELVDAFSLERCTPSNAVFDLHKLDWLNGIQIRRLASDELAHRLVPYLAQAGLIGPDPDGPAMAKVRSVAPLIQERLRRLDEAPDLVGFIFRPPTEWEEAPDRAACAAAGERLAGLTDWTAEAIGASLRALAVQLGVKPVQLFMPLRLAISGRKVTSPIIESLAILGREETLARLRVVLDQ